MNKELHGLIEYIKTIRGRIEGVFAWLKGGTAVNTTDTVKVTGAIGTDVGFEAVSGNGTGRVYFGVGSGGANHGVYSRVIDNWLIYSDGTNTYVDGKNTADILTIETGTWNTWYYHKYSDGRLEMWRTWTGPPTGSKHYWESGSFRGYRSEGWVVNGMVVGTDYQVDVNWKIGSGFSMAAGVNRNSNGTFHIYGIGTEANVSSVTVHLHLMGRWK